MIPPSEREIPPEIPHTVSECLFSGFNFCSHSHVQHQHISSPTPIHNLIIRYSPLLSKRERESEDLVC